MLLTALLLAAGGCEPTAHEDSELEDHMLTEIVAMYGQPTSDTIIAPADGLKKYQSGIRRRLPARMLEEILVREVMWEKRDERTIVWFMNMTGTWRAFNRRVEPL